MPDLKEVVAVVFKLLSKVKHLKEDQVVSESLSSRGFRLKVIVYIEEDRRLKIADQPED